MKPYLKILLVLILLTTSLRANAVFCNNGTARIEDDVNVLLSVGGLINQRAKLGSPVVIEASSFFADVTAPGEERTINLKVELNSNTLIDQSTTDSDIGPGPILYEGTFGNLSLGTQYVSASSSSAINCQTNGAFIIQAEPTASAPSFITKTISADTSSSTASVTLDASYTVDQVNALNGNAPSVSWEVNGQTYNSNPVSVSLFAGNYTATFRVDDGTFEASDSTSITIADQLQLPNMSVEAMCSLGQSGVFISWGSNSFANNYEVEYKPQFGSWSMITTTSSNSYFYNLTPVVQTTDVVRVRACSNNRCGPYRTTSYLNAGCSGPYN